MHASIAPSQLVAPRRGIPLSACFRGSVVSPRRAWPHPRRTPRCRSFAIAAIDEPAALAPSLPTEGEPGLEPTEAELYAEFEALLDAHTISFRPGDKVKGLVVQVDQKGAYVDVGGKSTAFVPVQETALALLPRAWDALSPGSSRRFVIMREDQRGLLVLSLKRVALGTAWERLRQAAEADATLTGVVAATNRGGLLIDLEGVRGFNPSSQIGIRTTNWEELIGRQLQFKILEVDEEANRLMLSHRRVMNEDRADSFKVGDVVEGRVMSVKPYGAFVDLGAGSSGLLHISQISSARIAAVEKVLAPEDRIKVLILSLDRDKGRVSLSTKRLEPEPGDMLKDPALVYARAEEMAALYRAQVAAAEAAARSHGVGASGGSIIAAEVGTASTQAQTVAEAPAASQPSIPFPTISSTVLTRPPVPLKPRAAPPALP